MSINERFFNELFVEKTVQVGQSYYTSLYQFIWPIEADFIDFLRTQDSSIRIEKAKSIYAYLCAKEDIFLPERYLRNIIWLQQHMLSPDQNGYTPQDHVVHCVNLYILGIYLIFNQEKIFIKLTQTARANHRPMRQVVKELIFDWKMFAFYHDHGYFIEAYIGNQPIESSELHEIIETYNHLHRELLYTYIIRGLAKALLVSALHERSTKKLLDYMPIVGQDSFLRDNREKFSESEIRAFLKQRSNYTYVDAIHTLYGLEYLLPFVSEDKILFVFTDSDDRLFGLFYVDTSGPHIIAASYEDDKRIRNFAISGNQNSISREECCYICVGDFDSNYIHSVLNHDQSTYRAELLYDAALLPDEIQTKFKFISKDSDLDSIYYDIYIWLTRIAPYKLILNGLPSDDEKYLPFRERALIEAINCIVQDNAKELLLKKNISEVCISLGSRISTLSEQKILRKATDYYEKEIGATSDIKEILYRAFRNAQQKIPEASHITVSGADELQYSFVYFPLEKRSDTKIPNLYNELKDTADVLHIDFEQLLNYQPTYTVYDHGLVSGSLLFSAITLSIQMIATGVDSIVTLGINNQNNFRFAKQSHNWAQVLFSIFIHNIYTINSAPDYGIDYKHDWDLDPFSFFCALTDSLQKWHRPKQVDQSKRGLPSNHFLDDSYDIYVDDNYIVVKCEKNALEALSENLNALNDYLPGAELMIKIVSI